MVIALSFVTTTAVVFVPALSKSVTRMYASRSTSVLVMVFLLVTFARNRTVSAVIVAVMDKGDQDIEANSIGTRWQHGRGESLKSLQSIGHAVVAASPGVDVRVGLS